MVLPTLVRAEVWICLIFERHDLTNDCDRPSLESRRNRSSKPTPCATNTKVWEFPLPLRRTIATGLRGGQSGYGVVPVFAASAASFATSANFSLSASST